jgi:hypothetical protein
MSCEALKYVFDLEAAPNGVKITTLERGTLCYLANFASKDGMAWPAAKALAGWVGCSVSTQRMVLNNLVKKEILRIETKPREQGRAGAHLVAPLAYAFIELQPQS